MKILLLVDLEAQYFLDDNYLFLLEEKEWETAWTQLKKRYDEIAHHVVRFVIYTPKKK